MSCHHRLPRRPSHGKAAASLGLAALTVLLLAEGRPAFSNDVDLLRFNTAKPYVFFIVDTSASMTQSPSGQWVHANADDPRSKLYQAKRVIYEVMQTVEDVHFGFAAFNQDEAAVKAKHWLYYTATNLPASWPISYPRTDPDGPIQFQADGSPVGDVEGDLMTFGPHVDATGIAGTCTAPLSLDTQREKINRYAKLGSSGNGPTQLWLTSGTGGNARTYRLTVTRPGNKPDSSINPKLGRDSMHVAFTLQQVQPNGCTGPQTANFQATYNHSMDLELWTDFLMLDQDTGGTSAPSGSHAGGIDPLAGFWSFKDIADLASCGSGHPFSGKGWEGNYDGSAANAVPAGVDLELEDPYCNPANPGACYNLRIPTLFDNFGRPLDRGDVLPLDWRTSNKAEFLDRLAPNQSDGAPDFRIASYFQDVPDAATGVLRLKETDESPLLATGATPLGKSVVDFRCWYLGDGNKCGDDAYNPGWEDIAQRWDSSWGCRRPYLIVISDGNDTCGGENPCADTANLNSQAGVKTWVLAFGANCNAAGNPLKCMAQNGKGELLCPQTANDLKAELQRILGLIREEARAFASAAVPSVQAIVEDKIFLTNFTPLNGKSVWDGHLHSFLKPLPQINPPIDNRPDATHERHLWDAGEVLRLEQYNAGDPLGLGDNQRRVFYRPAIAGQSRRLLEPLPPPPATGADPNAALRRDLWDGFGIFYIPGDSTTETAAENRVRSILQAPCTGTPPCGAFTLKTHTGPVVDPVTGNPTTRTIEYLLGDIFHSNPLVTGSPPNTRYYALDLHNYRDFFRKHELRRKMLVVGSNDGMVHVFDAGTVDIVKDDPATSDIEPTVPDFNGGTGREIFAFMPREAMPAVHGMAYGTNHQWGVDGTVAVQDVFIDPRNQATPVREWRSVMIGGLREGGASYYALDVTQPDKVVSKELTEGPFWVPFGTPELTRPRNPVDAADRPAYSNPSCLSETGAVPSGCGTVPFPHLLWEFTDSVTNAEGRPVRLDEDANGKPDLGATWSTANVGRIRVKEAGALVEKYVAVVGGGFDPNSKSTPQSGNWLYMIDVETGQAIYKRRLEGAVPSEPAAVDLDSDGFLDRIYVGTTFGFMYRVDLGKDAGGDFPSLATTNVRALDGAMTYTQERVPTTSWIPRIIFDTNFDLSNPLPNGEKRPIYFRPSVIFVAQLGKWALSFGAGDREDLWSSNLLPGRFYVFIDDFDLLSAPLTEASLSRVTVSGGLATGDYVLDNSPGNRGWYLVLDPDERVITDSFALSGVTIFSTFKPDVEVSGGRDPLCSKTGISRIFIVSTVNGDPLMTTREIVVPTYVTNPYTEMGQTRNPGDESYRDDDLNQVTAAEKERLLRVMESLKALLPGNCRFSAMRRDIKTVSADTGVVFIAPVPICIIEKNWRDVS